MATHGTQTEDWSTYEERLKHYLIANDVLDADKKRSILLTVCGAPTYKLLRSLSGNSQDTTSYKDLVKLLTTHYNPKPSAIVQRFHFNTRSRGKGESIAAYVAALRDLALHCDYGDKLSEMLRDRLVCGVNHTGIQRKLLAHADLTYQTAYTLALSVEASERDTKTLEKQQRSDPTPPLADAVHYTSKPKPPRWPKGPPPNISCYRCGGPHLAPQCKHKDVTCNFESVCKGKLCQASSSAGDRNNNPKKQTHYIAKESSSKPEDEELRLFTLTHPSSKPYMVEMVLNDVPMKMELDTGASVSVINEATYRHIEQSGPPLQPATGQLRTYTGDCIQVLGITEIKVRYGERELLLSAHIVNGGGPNLMGRDWLSLFEVNLCDSQVIQSVEQADPIQTVLTKYPDVFSGKLGCAKSGAVKLTMNDQAKPNPELYKVEAELDSLQEQGVISPVKSSPWAAPIVPVLKINGKIRICADYKTTVNQATHPETYNC